MIALRVLLTAAPLLCLCACATGQTARPGDVPAQISAPPVAKNVILFIGDGMGISTVTAARIYDGQTRGETGEENFLSFERFPQVALVKTYNTDSQVPDSAGTASSMNTGQKTRAGMIGVGPQAHRGNCAEAQAAILPNIAQRVHAAGKAIGIVSTMRLTHATPAAVYAHVPERDWEADSDIPASERAKGCDDIASQLLSFPFDVALGGGLEKFRGSAFGGRRLDKNADLLADWQRRTGGLLVTDATELSAARGTKAALLGLFAKNHLTYMLERKPDTTQPTLADMTSAAIDKVSADPDGYFLMIEGGNIDHGHHEGRADIALSETQELSHAVEVALAKVDLSNTLILVTADHSHVMTMAGYTMRGNPILGLAMGVDGRGEPTGKPIIAADGRPYSTLGYQNGPGAVQSWPRPAPTGNPSERKQALVPTGNVFGDGARLSETHGGEDVALYATGPGADGSHGVIEQNQVYDIILRAFGLSD